MEVTLPGLGETDVLILYSRGDSLEFFQNLTCALTLEVIDSSECQRTFVRGLVDSLAEKHAAKREALLKDILKKNTCDDPLIAQIKECKHAFSALPLIYNLMTVCFKCPICRCGSNKVVDISNGAEDAAKSGLHSKTWDIMCGLARMYREDVTADAEEHNRQAVLAIVGDVLDLRSSVTFHILFGVVQETEEAVPATVILRMRPSRRTDRITRAGGDEMIFETGKHHSLSLVH